MICVADKNQMMPDYKTYGFAYISPKKLKDTVGANALDKTFAQINILSGLSKKTLEDKVKDVLGRTIMVTSKDDHVVYKESQGEAEEGKTMGSVLPVLFLLIAILTMVTTMHRIATKA